MDNIDFINNHPIPGEGLTNSKESPLPYEKPPEMVDLQEASTHIWQKLTKEENIPQLLRMLRRDIPVSDIAQVTTYAGFANGKWSYDLSLQLMEPTMYMIMELANKAGAKYVFSSEMPDLEAEASGEKEQYVSDQLSKGDEVEEGLMVDEASGEI